MPIYEYQCTKCGEVFEAFQKITDKPLARCKFCSSRVERLISQSSFQLKGSGWYMTDYARKNQPAKAAGQETKPGEKVESGKTEKAKESSSSAKKE